MRTNIDIDDELMRQAMAATGTTTKRAVVEAALRLLVDIKGQEEFLGLFGKVPCEDIDALQSDKKVPTGIREDVERNSAAPAVLLEA
jgi:Arc/MetJ family transcription regulator